MVSAADSRLTKAVAYARAHGVRISRELAFNFVLPFLIFNSISPSLGAVVALMIASTPPILWAIAAFIRERKVDAISILVLSGIALSLLAFAGGGGVKFLQLRENLVTGLVGLIFLGSAAIGRPLIYQLSRSGVRRRAADKVQAFEALRDDTQFRRSMTVATLVWGFGLLAACALNCALVFVLTIKHYLLIGGPLNYAIISLLTVWTFWYVPRAARLAGVGGAAAEQAEPASALSPTSVCRRGNPASDSKD
jgi:hypothetical protein